MSSRKLAEAMIKHNSTTPDEDFHSYGMVSSKFVTVDVIRHSVAFSDSAPTEHSYIIKDDSGCIYGAVRACNKKLPPIDSIIRYLEYGPWNSLVCMR